MDRDPTNDDQPRLHAHGLHPPHRLDPRPDPRPGASGPGGPAASDRGLPLEREVLADLIRVVNRPDHDAWVDQVRRVGGCSHPLHLAGFTRRVDSGTGEVVSEFSSHGQPGGVVLGRCKNRRSAACPSCARLYHGDMFHLVRAGLTGGKGVPVSVAAHPRIFLTLTAPGFGAVHTTRTTRHGKPGACRPLRTRPCPHGAATSCPDRHDEDDPVVGAPLCPDCYDYIGAVIWQASIGNLWRRFVIYLPRHLARATGITPKQLRAQVRLSYVKIVEFQRRGLVHVHAVIRADAAPNGTRDDARDDAESGNQGDAVPQGAATGATATQHAASGTAPVAPPPSWVTAALLDEAARTAAAAVSVPSPLADLSPTATRGARVPGSAGGQGAAGAVLRWGEQLDVQDITDPNPPTATGEAPDAVTGQRAGQEAGPGAGRWSGRRVALYVAKYATKGTEATGWAVGGGSDGTARALHAQRMMRTALELAPVPELAGLKLGRWARYLGYRGHVGSKSRRYSTTMTALRAARAHHYDGGDVAHPEGEPVEGEPVGGGAGELVEVSEWTLTGHGYSPGEALIAADIARDAALNCAAAREAGAALPGGREGPREATFPPKGAAPASTPGGITDGGGTA